MASPASSTEDPIFTVKQQHQTGNSIITVKQEQQTGDSIITVKHEHQTGDSIITVKHEHQTGDSFITVNKQQRPTKDSFINVTVKDVYGRVQEFRVKSDEQLMMRWRARARMEDYEIVHFVFNGRMFNNDKHLTANDIGLKDGDCISTFPSWWAGD